MKVDVPGRGAVDIRRVAIVGPAWTDLDMYRETCALLQGTADAVEADAIEFGWLPWPVGTNGQMLRRMVRELAAECDDGTPCIDGVCLLPGWNTDGADDLRRGRGEHVRRRRHGAGEVAARPRTGRRGEGRGGERAMKMHRYTCERCGETVAMELPRYARTVLADSVRVKGTDRELCPGCICGLRGWFEAGGKRKGGE